MIHRKNQVNKSDHPEEDGTTKRKPESEMHCGIYVGNVWKWE